MFVSPASESTMEPRLTWIATFRIATVVLVLCVAGCGGPSTSDATDSTADPEGSTSGSERVDPEEIERLRALGYISVGDPLPPDARVGVLTFERDLARPGLNLFTNSHFCTTQLMDMDGEIVHSWSFEPCFRWGNALLSPSGELLVMGRTPHEQNPAAARESRYLMKLSWDGRVLWSTKLAAHHDVEMTPDGHLMTLTYELRIIEEADPEIPVRDHSLVLLTAEGDVVEQVSLWELLQSAPDVFEMQHGKHRLFEGGREIDALHANSVEWVRHPELIGRHPIYGENSVLICVRNQDAILIIDWAEKKPVWAWGQGELMAPHDATLLPSGNVLVFDNGLGRKWSRVVEVDPIRREIVWEYRAPDPLSFYSGTRGANQRLSNGHTLITESDSGRAFEVDPEGRIVWEFLNPNLTDKREPSVIVRMRRFEDVQYADLAARIESDRGLPFRVD
jgi:hypothetical protein